MVVADIEVEVVFADAGARPQRLRIASGATVLDVLNAAVGVFDLRGRSIGIFGRPVTLTDLVCAHDRVEIYRPLLTDPKERRRTRARDAARKCAEVSVAASRRSAPDDDAGNTT
ncbi:MAG: RnfH family protein [Acidiferrobacter sp.]